MIQKKIHRLVRLINKFTFDDIAITLELNKEDEKKAHKYLSSLIKKGIIRKISADMYQYIDNQAKTPAKKYGQIFREHKVAPKVRINPKVIDISKDDNYQLYLNSSATIKKRIDKYLAVIQASEGLKGSHLESFLKQWNKQFPEMKTSRSSLLNAKKSFISGGLAALLLNRKTPENNSKKEVYDVMYNYFKGYYLTHKAIFLTKAYNLAIKKFKRLNPEINTFKMPTHSYFRKRLAADFTKEEIRQFRTIKIKGVPIERETS